MPDDKKDKKQKAAIQLEELGAVREKREDRFSDTKTGWWLDGVFLGPISDPVHCLNVVQGN